MQISLEKFQTNLAGHIRVSYQKFQNYLPKISFTTNPSIES